MRTVKGVKESDRGLVHLSGRNTEKRDNPKKDGRWARIGPDCAIVHFPNWLTLTNESQ
jgi:hypothetical protein